MESLYICQHCSIVRHYQDLDPNVCSRYDAWPLAIFTGHGHELTSCCNCFEKKQYPDYARYEGWACQQCKVRKAAAAAKIKGIGSSARCTCFAASNFKRLYDAQDVPTHQDQIFGAVRVLVKEYCDNKGVSLEIGDVFFETLQREAFGEAESLEEVLERVPSAAQRLWTSAKQLQALDPAMRKELYFMINDSIRMDHEAMLLQTVVLVRAINQLCTVRGARDPRALSFPQDGILWRGGALPDEYKSFFTPGKKFRVPGFLATSMKEETANLFVYTAYDSGQPTVKWQVCLDPRGEHDIRHRCKHVNYVTSSHFGEREAEYLFAPYSTFEVVSTSWAPTPDDVTPHSVVLRAAVDNRKEPEDLPLAPWY